MTMIATRKIANGGNKTGSTGTATRNQEESVRIALDLAV